MKVQSKKHNNKAVIVSTKKLTTEQFFDQVKKMKVYKISKLKEYTNAKKEYIYLFDHERKGQQ